MDKVLTTLAAELKRNMEDAEQRLDNLVQPSPKERAVAAARVAQSYRTVVGVANALQASDPSFNRKAFVQACSN